MAARLEDMSKPSALLPEAMLDESMMNSHADQDRIGFIIPRQQSSESHIDESRVGSDALVSSSGVNSSMNFNVRDEMNRVRSRNPLAPSHGFASTTRASVNDTKKEKDLQGTHQFDSRSSKVGQTRAQRLKQVWESDLIGARAKRNGRVASPEPRSEVASLSNRKKELLQKLANARLQRMVRLHQNDDDTTQSQDDVNDYESATYDVHLFAASPSNSSDSGVPSPASFNRAEMHPAMTFYRQPAPVPSPNPSMGGYLSFDASIEDDEAQLILAVSSEEGVKDDDSVSSEDTEHAIVESKSRGMLDKESIDAPEYIFRVDSPPMPQDVYKFRDRPNIPRSPPRTPPRSPPRATRYGKHLSNPPPTHYQDLKGRNMRSPIRQSPLGEQFSNRRKAVDPKANVGKNLKNNSSSKPQPLEPPATTVNTKALAPGSRTARMSRIKQSFPKQQNISKICEPKKQPIALKKGTILQGKRVVETRRPPRMPQGFSKSNQRRVDRMKTANTPPRPHKSYPVLSI